MSKIWLKLTAKTGVFLVSLLWTYFTHLSDVFIIDFEQVNASRETIQKEQQKQPD